MKPNTLLAGPLREVAGQMGPQARRWYVMDLPPRRPRLQARYRRAGGRYVNTSTRQAGVEVATAARATERYVILPDVVDESLVAGLRAACDPKLLFVRRWVRAQLDYRGTVLSDAQARLRRRVTTLLAAAAGRHRLEHSWIEPVQDVSGLIGNASPTCVVGFAAIPSVRSPTLAHGLFEHHEMRP